MSKGVPTGKTRLAGFIWIGLGVCLLLALFLSPFASSHPDGLEKVAETHGFSKKGAGSKILDSAPLRDYSFPGIKNQKLSTALSGLAGTLAIFLLVVGIGTLIKTTGSRNPSCRNK